MMFILIIDIVFILSPSLPKVRVRVTRETETARSGPGQAARRKTGQVRRRGRPGGNFTIIALLLAAAAWPWWRWLVGLARQQQGRLPDRAGLHWSQSSGCVGSSRFPWHWLDTGTATGHSDSSSGTGLVSLRSARLLLPALPEK